MEFFNDLSLGYQIMVVGIGVFLVGVVIMFIENILSNKSNNKEFIVKNTVSTNDNYQDNNINPKVDDSIPNDNELNKNSELMDMFK